MAIGKPRGNKRSSSGSCSSTVTMLVFVTVCVLGVWMLTSNSAVYRSTTTQINKSDHDSLLDTERRSVKFHRKIPIDKLLDLTTNASDFLMDVMQKGDESKAQNDLEKIKDTGYEVEEDGNSGGVRVANNEAEPKEETKSNDVDDDAESLNDSDAGKQEAEQLQEEAIEKQEMEISTKVIEDSLNGMEGEASAEEEQKQITQKIKENVMTTNDQESGNGYDQQSDIGNKDDKEIEPSGEDDTHELEDKQEQESTNEEKEKTTQTQEEEEEQEEDEKQGQSQEGVMSDDQVQQDDDEPIKSHSIASETRVQAENREELDVRKKMEQAKIETNIANTKHSTADKERNSQMPKESETQVDHKERQKVNINGNSESSKMEATIDVYGYKWELCNVTAGTNYIPCLDNDIAIRNLQHWLHNENQERHCPKETPECLIPLPQDYRTPIPWPQSREKIWFNNIQNKALSDLKGKKNWVKVEGEIIRFPSAGTRFIHGARHYIDFLEEAVPEISWGKRTRVILDVGCGAASFGGYLFDKDVLAMSFSPKDEQEAQIQFALERGLPAISAVMGTQRLPFPSGVFDLVHCVHCRVPWHKEGGILLLEVNRLLRPGGYFVWSAPPVYQTHEEDIQIWKEMSALTVAMCWELVTISKDKVNAIGVAIYHKPDSNECYAIRKIQQPPMCKPNNDPNAAWYEPLQVCMHEVAIGDTERGSHWPEEWPNRVQNTPYWLSPANEFETDYDHWKEVVSKLYMTNLGISWSNIRNVMDMRAVYGGFGAALKDLNLWVLNVVNIDSPDTLPIIFERGLFGIYHDWCESFSTYPRTYDLLHADYLFSNIKNRCKIKGVMAEMDRILRPGGYLIARDESSMIKEIEKLVRSLHWEVNSTFTCKQEGIISGRKSTWRPTTYAVHS